jgi:hypothetical protein
MSPSRVSLRSSCRAGSASDRRYSARARLLLLPPPSAASCARGPVTGTSRVSPLVNKAFSNGRRSVASNLSLQTANSSTKGASPHAPYVRSCSCIQSSVESRTCLYDWVCDQYVYTLYMMLGSELCRTSISVMEPISIAVELAGPSAMMLTYKKRFLSAKFLHPTSINTGANRNYS